MQHYNYYLSPPAMLGKKAPLPENETVLIINELSTKTHETTGNKPEKPDMTNKFNMKLKTQLSPIRSIENSNHLQILIPAKNNLQWHHYQKMKEY